jgi:hypothetical protein
LLAGRIQALSDEEYMGIDKELRNGDEQKMNAIFDSLFASDLSQTDAEVEKFKDAEVALALQRYGILRVIYERFDETVPTLHGRGMSNEKLGGLLTGIELVISALGAYAAAEAPDTPE